jgi:hypothetical protein
MRISVTVVWLFILLIDVIDIMRKMKLDEREKIHEAIAERNALWGIMVVLIFGILYDLVTNALNEKVYVNPFIMAALIVALLIKSLSNYILGRKN